MNAISHHLDPVWKTARSEATGSFMRWTRGFENRMRVGTTETERVDTGSANTFRPVFGFGDDLKSSA